MPTESDWAWLAGFVDGEGCIAVWRETNRQQKGKHYTVYKPILTIQTSEASAMRWVHENFGGMIAFLNQRPKQKHKPIIRVSWAYRKAKPILEGIVPYMKTNKKDQALLVLDFMRTIKSKRGNRPVSEQEHEERMGVVRQLSVLKRVVEN